MSFDTGSPAMNDAFRPANAGVDTRLSMLVQQQRFRARRISHHFSSPHHDNVAAAQLSDAREIAAVDRFFGGLQTVI